MSAFYSVKVKKCRVQIRASNTDAKQVLFGWAGGSRAGMELYGRGTGRGYGDREVWEWNLSNAGVNDLMHGLVKQLQDPKYKGSPREQAAAKALAFKVSAAATRLKKSCRVK